MVGCRSRADPRFYRNTEAIVEQAAHFNQLAPNMIVKVPVTRAGIPAIEEANYRGISVNATSVQPAAVRCGG